MNPLLVGRWRGVRWVNAKGTETPLGNDYGPLFRIHEDGTVEHSYKHGGQWGAIHKLQVKQEGNQSVITGDAMPYYVYSINETELVLVIGRYKADLTYYLRRV
jgi:hypothetical protein